ncbi:MAG: sensor histidine kinase [Pseudomonadales bacterium]
MTSDAYQRAYQREKAARMESERLLEELSREIYAKNEELEKLYDDLKKNQGALLQHEKLASVGQLASGIAHEINNPVGFCLTNLNALSDFSPLILDACKAAKTNWSEAQQREAAYLIEDLPNLLTETIEGLQSIQTIVSDLRNYSRNTDNDSLSNADLNDGLKSTLNVLRNKIGNRYTIDLNLNPLPLIECNLGKLNQVFSNLIINAMQAMPEGGRLYVDSFKDHDRIVVRISDDGPGISEAVANEIFQPFFTTKDVGEGTGLGLSICRSIIHDLHKGELTLVSEGKGRGATFQITLPISL